MKIKADETTDWSGLKRQNEQPDPYTLADHVINIICAAVLLWVLWEATKGFV